MGCVKSKRNRTEKIMTEKVTRHLDGSKMDEVSLTNKNWTLEEEKIDRKKYDKDTFD